MLYKSGPLQYPTDERSLFASVYCFHSVIVNHICEVHLVFAVVTTQEIKQRVELVQLLFCVILQCMVRKTSVNTGGGSVCQSKSIEISAVGNGINMVGRSHIREVKHTTLQAAKDAGIAEGTGKDSVRTVALQKDNSHNL